MVIVDNFRDGVWLTFVKKKPQKIRKYSKAKNFVKDSNSNHSGLTVYGIFFIGFSYSCIIADVLTTNNKSKYLSLG